MCVYVCACLRVCAAMYMRALSSLFPPGGGVRRMAWPCYRSCLSFSPPFSMRAYAEVGVCACMRASAYVCVRVHVYVCMCACCACVHVCMCACARMYV